MRWMHLLAVLVVMHGLRLDGARSEAGDQGQGGDGGLHEVSSLGDQIRLVRPDFSVGRVGAARRITAGCTDTGSTPQRETPATVARTHERHNRSVTAGERVKCGPQVHGGLDLTYDGDASAGACLASPVKETA